MTAAMNRREFLSASAAGAGAVLIGRQLVMAGENGDWPPKMPPAKIYKVYIGRTGGIYLSRPTDEIDKFNEYLSKLEQKLGDVKFIGGELVPPTEVDAVLPKLKDADGALLFHLCGHGGDAPEQAMAKIINTDIPATVFSQPFSGHGWMYFPRWQKEGKKVVLLPSSDWREIDRGVALMRVAPHPRNTRIPVVRGPLGTAPACNAELVKQKLGVELVAVTVEETLKAHQAVETKDAEA